MIQHFKSIKQFGQFAFIPSHNVYNISENSFQLNKKIRIHSSRFNQSNDVDYKNQRLEMQRIRLFYSNVSFKNLLQLVKQTSNALELIFQLEQRLDTVLFRLKFAQTMFQARQFINHHHILINGALITRPSFHIQSGDIIQFKNPNLTQLLSQMTQFESKESILLNRPVQINAEIHFQTMTALFIAPINPYSSESLQILQEFLY